MGDFGEIKIGVCNCEFTPPGAVAAIPLGLTAGGVVFKYTSKWHEIKADQYGDTIIDAALVGEGVSVRIPMIESVVDKLKYAITAGTEIKDVPASKSKLTIGARPGLRAQDRAGKLVLHPISAGVLKGDDVTIHKALVLNSDIELPFKVDNERVLQVDFVGLVDKGKADGSYLAEIGDPTTVATPGP